MGSTVDGVANPISLMHELIAKDKRNAERIFPYIGGEEVNDSPTHIHRRYVIDFYDMPLDQASKWPELVSIIREKVKPDRDKQNRAALRKYWWHYAEKRPGLRAAMSRLQQVIVCCRHQHEWAVTMMPTGSIFAESLVVVTLPSYAAFSLIQSRIQEVWARNFGSSMKDDLRYTPSDCFETFPFPEGFESDGGLAAAGRAYYEFRADLMVRNDEGLTKTYNRFHDPNEPSADIARLRALHADMDRAVLAAYGGELAALSVPPCEFLLDYEDDDEDDDEPGKRAKKKPWRYRWPDAFRDEVLALLLDLNKQRAEQERLAATPPAKPPRGGRKKASNSGSDAGTPPAGPKLF